MLNKKLKDSDLELFNLINKEQNRQENELELIASENYVSKAVLEAMSSVLTNKYSEGYPKKRYYGGNQVIDEIEELAINRAKELFKAQHVNVQALSGSPANLAVYMAFLEPGDKVLGLKLDHGGHLSHGHQVNFSGRLYNFVQYGVDKDTQLINMKEVREIALKEKPKMIIAGFSAYSREIDWSAFKSIADEIKAYTFADISHVAGLIAAGLLNNPVEIFDVVSTTTHKTLRGPRGGIIMCQEKYAKQVDRAVFPGIQGGPHNHMTAAKAVCFKEALNYEFKEYSKQVIKNAKSLSDSFLELNYKIISGGTDNHLLVIDLSDKNISGKEAEKLLETVGISVSRSTIPNDPKPPFNPSGIRIGSAALTTRGFIEVDMRQIVELIDNSFKNKDNEKGLESIKRQVNILCNKYPLNYDQNN